MAWRDGADKARALCVRKSVTNAQRKAALLNAKLLRTDYRSCFMSVMPQRTGAVRGIGVRVRFLVHRR